MRQIPLSQDKYAVVDDDDYEFVMRWKWCALKAKNTFYAVRNDRDCNGKRVFVYMHRVVNGTPDDILTDHRDGNGLNNLRQNLRAATRSQNSANMAPYKNCTSEFKGVSWHKPRSKWAAYIKVDGKKRHIGLFVNEADAAAAYAERAAIEFGDFHRTERPTP